MYPAYEETYTINFRWITAFGHPEIKELQQLVRIRDGIGEKAKYTEEWRSIPVYVNFPNT